MPDVAGVVSSGLGVVTDIYGTVQHRKALDAVRKSSAASVTAAQGVLAQRQDILAQAYTVRDQSLNASNEAVSQAFWESTKEKKFTTDKILLAGGAAALLLALTKV